MPAKDASMRACRKAQMMLIPTFDDLQNVETGSITGAFHIRCCRLTAFEYVLATALHSLSRCCSFLELAVEGVSVLDLAHLRNILNNQN
jgi:hypothetical protein